MYIIDKNAENEIIIKKSRFLGFYYEISSPNEVNSILENLKKVPIYLNNLIVNDKKSIIRFGDYIDIYGFKIYFLYNMILI